MPSPKNLVKVARFFCNSEGLKLFEEVSRRYKVVVKEHIPGIEYLRFLTSRRATKKPT
ncbi:hypothetical protein OK016_00800 [Vibrio chagasii]|nr:hypothetical protein [Vibrio chagasii]